MKVRPINAHVLVKPREAEQKTAGGVYLPDTAKEKPGEGEVVAVADDATDEVAVGDRVIHQPFTGTTIRLEGEEYTLMPSDSLLAKYVAADQIPD